MGEGLKEPLGRVEASEARPRLRVWIEGRAAKARVEGELHVTKAGKGDSKGGMQIGAGDGEGGMGGAEPGGDRC